jgi:2-polyprenyl-6-methoxyphenol hydroxylase-like FAD-dependent oxidoreductase
LFPGILDELVAEGVPVWKDGDLSKLNASFMGHRLARAGRLRDPLPTAQYCPSRPFLEYFVRRRVQAMTNVEILDGHELVGLTTTARGDRVTGVNVVSRDGAVETSLEADLVVDATGRGSRTPALLEALGYSRPREDELVVRLAYTSQRLRIPARALTAGLFIVYPEPGRLKTFVMLGCEDDTWMLTMSSMMGHASPSGREEMLQSAQDFVPVDAIAAVRASVPLGEVTHYRIPSKRWRRYDKMRRTPRVCSSSATRSAVSTQFTGKE